MQINEKLNSQKQESYDPIFFKRLASIEDEHFWFRARNEIIQSLIKQIVSKFPKGYRVLEIGCGTGNLLRVLSKTCSQGMVIGSDLYLGGLKFAQTRVTSPLIQADLHKLPFGSKFDMIGIFDVLEHIPNDEKVLESMNNSLAPGGILFLTVPAHPSLWSYSDEGARHFRRYSPSELKMKLLVAGFEIDYLTQYMAITFPLIWVVRKLRGILKGNKVYSIEQTTAITMSELKVPPIINPILYSLLRFEAWVVSCRLKLPFGTSLLVLAYKKGK